MLQPTTKPITVGRVVHVYSDSFSGPRPGTVVNALPGSSNANINVQLDGANDGDVIAQTRDLSTGNTLSSLPVLDMDPLATPTPTVHDMLDRGATYQGFGRCVAVWPPRT